MHHRRFLTDVLHDIDLTAVRPPDRVDVLPEHPERGPDPRPVGSWIRASTNPYVNATRSLLINRADVYCESDRRATIARLPTPSSEAFSVPPV